MASNESSLLFASSASSQSFLHQEESDENFQLFKKYILEKHIADVVRFLLEEENNVHYSIKIDGADLLENCVNLTDHLFFQSESMLKMFNRAFHAAMYIVYGTHCLKEHMSLKPFLHVRFVKLPSCSEIWRDRVPKAKDVGCFLALEGTVIRTSSAKILEFKKEYMCNRCKNVFSLQADFQLHYAVPTPQTCPVTTDCTGKKFVVVAGNDGTTGPKKCKDYQEIRVQEQVRKLSMGTIPRSMTIVLEDDLVDSCKPGGVPRTDSTGSRVRGECHLLLVGDPGTGKSQFLKYAAKVTPRSVLTTGIGSSSAGLTVSAIRDGPHWTLEAGALVLADGGICCIDEFSGIKEQDRSAIHEAMEQQTISVAKAGLVCKLNTRTSILAATNPKLGKYDEASSVSMNIAMASPLLSRFDLVLVLLDVKNAHWDSVVADYLLTGKSNADQKTNQSELWSLDQMQAYFGIIRQLTPSLSSEADQVLRAYYRCHRQSNSRNAARTTIRLLESLIRLSEAHARLMFRNVVTIQDAIATVTVVESSMQGGSLLPTGSILHSCFPKDADVEYQKHSRLVLQCLSLEHLFDKHGQKAPTVPKAASACEQTGHSVLSTNYECKDNVVSQTPSNQPSVNGGQSQKNISLQCHQFNSEAIDDMQNVNMSSLFKIKPGSQNSLENQQSTPRASTQKRKSDVLNEKSSNVSYFFKKQETFPAKVICTTSNQICDQDKNLVCMKTSHHSSDATNNHNNIDLLPQSQISLFSMETLQTASQSSRNSFSGLKAEDQWNIKSNFSTKDPVPHVLPCPTSVTSSITNQASSIFRLPDSEAKFAFSHDSEFDFGNETKSDGFSNLKKSDKKQANPTFSFTLDPCVIEEMSNDLDFF
ncbi:DNA helicase MCM9-like isoform X2 [Clavelina lepadiformis]|uniref:DNA helicase MCM9-like isoform X2 n=1 Tax=Clavelina lepadiformis TaxID=159417 RepID=UPI0040437D11